MRRLATIAAISMLPALAAGADLAVRQRISGVGPVGSPHEETQYWTATKRITDGPDQLMIIDIEARTMSAADKKTKTYQVIGFDDIRKQTDQLRAMFEKLPPEARKSMPDLDADVSVKPTGKSETIAGHVAKEYAIASGLATGTIWVTDDFAVPGDAKAWQDAMASMSGPGAPGGKLAAAMAKLNGVPLRSSFTTTAPGGQTFTTMTEALEVKAASPPAEALRMPADFTKTDLKRKQP